MMLRLGCLIMCLYLNAARAMPPDKSRDAGAAAGHIIKPRSIDLNSAHALVMEQRLPQSVLPTGYRLRLEPYLEDGLFGGQVAINLTWLQDSDEIVLHCAHDLNITTTQLLVRHTHMKEPSVVTIKDVEMEGKRPVAVLRLERAVPKDSWGWLRLDFAGRMNTASEGFFKATYTDHDTERTVMVAALALRPTSARRVFPCFDEPAFKSPFELSVVRPRNMIALSNTPVARTDDIPDEPDAVMVHFERTPPMSTFSLGLVIADLKPLDVATLYKDHNGNNIELMVWGRAEYLPALEGVQQKLSRVMQELAQYWAEPLPLRTLHVVALPGYQAARPADCFGLILFKESELSGRGYVQLAQEVCHQWLGALVSPSWWADAHLNKALVGYLAAETAFKINNGSEMEGKWPMTVLYSLYYEFSKRYPHSRITGMKQETASTKIELLFRMFNYTLGGIPFRNALRKFIKTHKFKTFNADNIWQALNTAAREAGAPADLDVRAAAHTWVSQDRLPLLTAIRNYSTNELHVSQKLYLRERPHDVPDAGRMQWVVPLVVSRGDRPLRPLPPPEAWLRHRELTLTDMPSEDAFLILNPEEIAPCPVNYDSRNWQLVSTFLQSERREELPELTRAKLLHDAWNLAYAGELPFPTALNMTLFLRHERHHLVWDPVFTMIDHIGRHICQCMQDKFQAYVRILLTPLYSSVSVGGEQPQRPLRAMARSFLCAAGQRACVQHAQQEYGKWMAAASPDDGNPISNQYICPVFKWGSLAEWQFGLERVQHFPAARQPSERTFLLKSLAGCPQDDLKIHRLLNVTLLDPSGNWSDTDVSLVLSMVSGSPAGHDALFRFLQAHWDALRDKYLIKTNLWDNLITSAMSQFTTREGLELVTALYKSRRGQFGSAEHIAERSIRNAKEEADWSERHLPLMDQWLDWFLHHSTIKDDQFIRTKRTN